MCKKPNELMREVKWIASYRKDNQPPDEDGNKFWVLLRPCICGNGVVGRVPDGTVYAEVEDVIL